MSYFPKEELERIKRDGCEHVGSSPPSMFSCIDCDDNAKDCNCNDCMGVFCEQCQEMLNLNCEDIRMAYYDQKSVLDKMHPHWKKLFKDGKLSERYYRNQDRHVSRAYQIGRAFEYRVMHTLVMDGWHCMRRFGSHGVKFCGKCGRHISRNMKTCNHCKTSKHILKASLDITAYKDGVYLMITCKYSLKGATFYMTDKIWRNLITYANFYGAIPVFAGVTTKRRTYFTSLLSLQPIESYFFNDPASMLVEIMLDPLAKVTYKKAILKKPDEEMIKRLIKESWDMVTFCNTMLEDNDATKAEKARWGTIKVQMLNVINRSLYKAGLNIAPQDLAQVFKTGEEELKKGEKVASISKKKTKSNTT